jgi:hypothetical protein
MFERRLHMKYFPHDMSKEKNLSIKLHEIDFQTGNKILLLTD